MTPPRPSQPQPPEAGLWPTMLPLLLGILFGALGVSMVNTALPQIAADLDLADTVRSWIVDSYPLTTAVTIVVAARLGDRYGRRRIFVLGTIGYGVFSLLAALSTVGFVLIVMRVLMGASAALIVSSVVSTIGTLFTGRDLIVANGLWVAVFGLGSSLGPMLGGFLTEVWSWQAVFVFCIPLAALALVLSLFCLVETRSARATSFDVISIVTSAVAIGAIVLGIKQISTTPVLAAVLLVGGGLILAWFIRRQGRLAEPLILTSLFTKPRFTSASLQIFIGDATSTASVYLLSIHLQNHFGQTPAEVGLALTPQAVATIAGGLIAPWVSMRVGKPAAIFSSMSLQAVGLIWLGCAPTSSLVPLVLIGIGFGFIGALSTTTLFESAPRDAAGQVGAIQEVVFALGSGCGIAIFATLALIREPLGFTISLVIAGALVLLIAPTAFLRGRGTGHRKVVAEG